MLRASIDKLRLLPPIHGMQPAPDRDRLRLSAMLGFLAIALGAMGAHGVVHDRLKAAGELEHWETAVSYHLPLAVLLVVLALFGSAGGRLAAWSWRCLFGGVVLFSGSLYVLAYTQIKWLGAVTPLGGLFMLAGWLLLALSRWSRP